MASSVDSTPMKAQPLIPGRAFRYRSGTLVRTGAGDISVTIVQTAGEMVPVAVYIKNADTVSRTVDVLHTTSGGVTINPLINAVSVAADGVVSWPNNVSSSSDMRAASTMWSIPAAEKLFAAVRSVAAGQDAIINIDVRFIGSIPTVTEVVS